MLINLVNYFLVFSTSIEILLIWLLLKQKNKTFFSSAFIYVIILFFLDTVASIFIVNSSSVDVSLVASKARFIIECFVIAVLYNFTHLFTFSNLPPKISLKNTFTFIIAFALSIGGLFNFFITNIQIYHGIYLPVFASYYWAFILFFLVVFYLIFVNIISKYRLARKKETRIVKEILMLVFPLAFLSLFTIYIFPFFQIFSPLIFLGHFVVAIFLIYSTLRFYILEADEHSSNLIPYTTTAGLFLIVFALPFDFETNLLTVLLSIPAFVFLVLGGNYLSLVFINIFKKFQLGQSENLDQKIEEFSKSLVQFIDLKQLWNFTGKFLQETFSFEKVAIVSFQYDVSPYQIELFIDFNQKNFERLISESNSLIIEFLESEQKTINKFELPDDSLLFQKMDSLDIYLGIPLLKQNEILGIIFLGGDRKFVRIPQRNLHLIKLISSQIAFTIDNIRTIQKTLQSRKMAEMGMLASQLAHDFQSFINLVKLENRDNNNRLSEHANHTEKLVQDLLNYSRPQELKFNLVNINHLIDMSLDLVELQQNIVIEKHYSENLPEINVDINQIRRVFTNLIENSNRAMINSKNKRLKITTRPLRPISKIQRSPWIYIEFLDEGIGISEENLEKIFDPFFTTYKSEGGNGIGLAIVKQIITRHHGFIDVTSLPNKGTIFNIRLPYIMI